MITREQAADLDGAELIDATGGTVGTLHRIVLDGTGEPQFATVRSGLPGGRETVVPLAQAERAGNAVRVPYEAATVTEGPHLDVDGGQLDETQQRLLYRFHGLDAAGRLSDRGLPRGPAGAPAGPRVASRHDDRPGRRP